MLRGVSLLLVVVTIFSFLALVPDANAHHCFGANQLCHGRCAGQVCIPASSGPHDDPPFCSAAPGGTCANVPSVGSSPVATVTHSPTTPNRSASVSITATGTDLDGDIDLIEIYLDDVFKKSCSSSPCTYNAGSFPNAGTHTYSTKIFDSGNNAPGTAAGTFVVSTNAPTVSITHKPTSPDTNQQVSFNASATDDEGLSSIKIFVDNTLVKTCDTPLNPTTADCLFTGGPYSSGSHTYYAQVMDMFNSNATSNATSPPTTTFTVTVPTPVTVITNASRMLGNITTTGAGLRIRDTLANFREYTLTPHTDAFDLQPGQGIVLQFRKSGGSTIEEPNDGSGDLFEIKAYYSNISTLVSTLHSNGTPPANNTNYTFYMTSDGTASGEPRVGPVRFRIYSKNNKAGILDYIASSDAGLENGTGYTATFYRQGYARSLVNITNVTTFKNPAYTNFDTKFMRGETVYLQFSTAASAWASSGHEKVTLNIQNGETIHAIALNFTDSGNVYRTSWITPENAELDGYEILFRPTSTLPYFRGSYTAQLSSETVNATINSSGLYMTNGTTILASGGVVTLNGTYTFRRINITNNARIVTGSSGGYLNLRAMETISISSNSVINATGRGGAGGSGGPAPVDHEGICSSLSSSAGSNGDGPAPGSGAPSNGNADTGGGGGGGGAGGAGGAGSPADSTGALGASGGTPFGSSSDRTAYVGSGGGGGEGACGNAINTGVGGNGGAGGGVIILDADTSITIEGKIEVDGLRGANGTRNSGGLVNAYTTGGGGGGSGGTIIVNSSKIIIKGSGSLSSRGGRGGDASAISNVKYAGPGGGGAGGRIKIFSIDLENEGSITVQYGETGTTTIPPAPGQESPINYGASHGSYGTSNIDSGQFFSLFHSSSLCYDNTQLLRCTRYNMTDPDTNDYSNATFWLEDEFLLIHDSDFPRLNTSSNDSWNRYLQRGEVLNYSFTVQDEWGRAFAQSQVNIRINSSSFDESITIANTSSSGELEGTIIIGNNWTDTYENTTANQSETKDYTIAIRFPSNVTSYLSGSFGANTSQNSSFDVDSNYYVTISPNSTSYKIGDIGKFNITTRNVRNQSVDGSSSNVKYDFYLNNNLSQAQSSAVTKAEFYITIASQRANSTGHKYRWYVIDAAGKVNSTTQTYVINKASTSLTATASGGTCWPAVVTVRCIKSVDGGTLTATATGVGTCSESTTSSNSIQCGASVGEPGGTVQGSCSLSHENYTASTATDSHTVSNQECQLGGVGESKQYSSEKIKFDSLYFSDTAIPTHSNILTYPTSPTTYSNTTNYTFNITVEDDGNIDDVILEFNGTNYTYKNGQVKRLTMTASIEYQFNTTANASLTSNETWITNVTSTKDNNTGSINTTFLLQTDASGVISQCSNDSSDACPQSEVNGYVYLKKIVSITNDGRFGNRTFWVTNQCPAGRDASWDSTVINGETNCDNKSKTINASETGNFTFRWRVQNLVTATNGSWEADTTRTSNRSIQYIRKAFNITNTDIANALPTLSLSISLPQTSLGGETCIGGIGNSTHCSHNLSIGANGQVQGYYVNASGDWIPGQNPTPQWRQDEGKTSSNSNQYLRKEVTVSIDAGSGLGGTFPIDWSESIKSITGCTQNWQGNVTSGTLTITPGNSNSTNATGYGDCITETKYGWTPDTSQTQTTHEQYITQKVQLENMDDSITFSNLAWSGLDSSPTCQNDRTCSDNVESGTVSSLAFTSATNVTLNSTGDWITNTSTSWFQTPGSTPVAGGDVNITYNITFNSSVGINFTSVTHTCAPKTTPVTWTNTQSSATLASIDFNERTIPYTCNATATNVTNMSTSSWLHNTDVASDIARQHLKRTITVTNRDPSVLFTGITWSTSADGSARTSSSTLSGTISSLATGATTTDTATAYGDYIDETYSNYYNINTSFQVNRTGASITLNLTLANAHASIGFSGFSTNISDPTPSQDWNCPAGETYTSGTVSAGGTTTVIQAKNCTERNTTVYAVGAFNWSQNTTLTSEVEGLAYVIADANITNNGSGTYTNLQYSNFIEGSVRRNYNGEWTCEVTTGTVNIPNPGPGVYVQTSGKPVKCYKKVDFITKSVGQEINTKVKASQCHYRYNLTINYTNSDPDVTYTGIKTSIAFANINATLANISGCASGTVSINSTNGTSWNINLSANGGTNTCNLNWAGIEQKPAVYVGSSGFANASGVRAGAAVKFTFNISDNDSPTDIGKMSGTFKIYDNRPDNRGGKQERGECTFTKGGEVECTYTVPYLNDSKDGWITDPDGDESYWTVEGTSKDDADCESAPFTGKVLVDRKGPRFNRTTINPGSGLVKINDTFNISSIVEDANLSLVELWIKPAEKSDQEFVNIQNFSGGSSANFSINITYLNQTYGTSTGTRVLWQLRAKDVAGNLRIGSFNSFFVSCETDHRFLQFKARPVSILTGKPIADAKVTLTLVDKQNPTNTITKETQVESDGNIATAICTRYDELLVSGKTYKLIIAVKTADETSYHVEDFTAP